MFKSLKKLIDSRLGKNIVTDDFSNEYGYFIKVLPHDLYRVSLFLKTDPDVRLTLLDQIISLSPHFLPWSKNKSFTHSLEIVYQFKSIKLPYKVSVSIEVHNNLEPIPSIAPLFLGAAWKEQDLKKSHQITIEETK